MKWNFLRPAVVFFVLLSTGAPSAVYYVDANNSSPAFPYTDWSTAATNIQDAVDAASDGDQILVTNGVYATGGRVVYGSLTNRVVINKAITVQSVNGPTVTVIQGYQMPDTINGDDAVRCVYLTNGATLIGFTLTNGATRTSGNFVEEQAGGGLWFESQTALASNCVVTGNSATYRGGGAFGGTLDNCILAGNSSFQGGGMNSSVLNNCVLTNNSASQGGGAWYGTLNNCLLTGNSAQDYYEGFGGGAFVSTLNNCTLTGNQASLGGGAHSATLNNCIIYFNTDYYGPNPFLDAPNHYSCTLNDCCTTPDDGGGSILTNEPLFVDPAGGDYHLQTNSSCINYGDNSLVTSANDFDGNPRIIGGMVDIGAYEFQSVILLNAVIQVDATNAVIGFPLYFAGLISGGRAATSFWDFGDGTVITNHSSVSHSWAAAGDYPVVFTAINDANPGGISATVTVHIVTQSIHYVALDSTNPVAPYLSWDTAATNIQDAVDAAVVGGTVLVSNGVYNVGGRVVFGAMTNRVAVDKPLTVRSVNGPAFTAVEGFMANDGSSIRCVYMTNDSTLSGFTLTGGATRVDGDGIQEQSGGGAWCESTNSVLTNCILSGNSAAVNGGGIFQGTLNNCSLSNNTAGEGGASYSSIIDDSLLANNSAGEGGGASSGTLNHCALFGNSSGDAGGGATFCTLNACLLADNSSFEAGGGAYASTIDHSVFTNNYSNAGGGAGFCSVRNSVLAFNTANWGGAAAGGELDNCTLLGNSAAGYGGGGADSFMNNCIVYYNTSPDGNNYKFDGEIPGQMNFCCTTPLPDDGTNNITAEPQLTDNAHISATSPCIGAGNPDFSSGTDIDGEAWLNPPSIGCDEFSGAATGALEVLASVDYTNCAVGFTLNLSGDVTGHATKCVWAFGDGTTLTNQFFSVRHSWASGGDYTVTLTAFNDDNPSGVSGALVIHVFLNPISYVSLDSVNPIPPFNSWATAATNIQDAVDAAIVGGTVLVTNGDYSIGARVVFGSMTNRVAVTKPLTLRSVNGPAFTAIEGFRSADTTGIRCVYLTNNAALIGFTLTNGATIQGADWLHEWAGAGAWCEAPDVVISNCLFINNLAQGLGGGGYGGTYLNCVFVNNFSGWVGGGVEFGTINNCIFSNNVSYHGGGAESSSLLNCSLVGNSTLLDSDYTANGGGASNCGLTNCVIAKNSSNSGGGVGGSTAVNCLIIGNTGGGNLFGGAGGAEASILINCTVAGNVAVDDNGGVRNCILTNSIVYFNTAPSETNFSDDSIFNYCDTMPLPTNGANNISTDPLFADSAHISADSPCRGTGIYSAASGVDIDSDPWLNPPSIGCDEFNLSSATGALAVAIYENFTNVATGFTADFASQICGHTTANVWNFGDGTIVSNELFFSHSWSAAGNYTVTFTVFNTDNPGGVTASVTIFVLQNPVHHVSINNSTPAAPYLSWATAATNIQDAVDAAFVGGTVLVSNGIYQTGARYVFNGSSNRVSVTKPLSLQSVNGVAMTIIDGSNSVRCLYLSNNVSVAGFTLQAGLADYGGGVLCQSSDDILNDCVLTGNQADFIGGGAYAATLNHCVLSNNVCFGDVGGYGGGAGSCTLNNCTVINNSAGWFGGGVFGCNVNNSLIVGNSAAVGGGASYYGTLNNCTVVGNTATYGGGAYYGSLNNSIFYYNNGDNYHTENGDPIAMNYCCTTPDPGGIFNITNEPAFVDWTNGDFHLQTNSPCINSGYNAYVVDADDLDGHPRIVGGAVDIGAYELQSPQSIISYAYLQRYGLPTDGSADYLDSDGDGFNNWQEWRAGTSPVDASSFLQMVSVTPMTDSSGATVTWQSVNGVNYFLQRSGDLSAQPPFSTIQSNIVGQAGTTTYTDTDATNAGPYFYRVGVQ